MTSKETVPTSRPAARLAFWAYAAIVLGVTIATLHFGQDLLIPLAVAALVFVLLTSVVDRIARQKVGNWQPPSWLAHVLGLGLVLLGLVAIATILSSQARDVAAAVPKYQERVAVIAGTLLDMIGESNANAVESALAGVDMGDLALTTVNSASGFLSGFFLMLLYVPFMMIERRPMRSKLALAASDPELGAEIAATVRHIAEGLQRYVGIKTFVSALTGALCYAVMKFVGLDFAETWGLLAFALNFIPTLGSAVAVILPAVAALVQFDGYSVFLTVAIGCGAVQFVIGNILEPALTGKSLNLSPLMVVVALTAWTLMWGIPGAFLSVPITVCVMIIFAHVPGMRWAAILMSGDGILSEGPNQETEDLAKEGPMAVPPGKT
ncbi:AI-2E family transporter [Seohaeicola saemankumensis]|nr:AI-2E family transporter [Seohaeicola saemankumensis]MCA0871470.1 AI-2E family transporter [Seohaeicola saemankumensis]